MEMGQVVPAMVASFFHPAFLLLLLLFFSPWVLKDVNLHGETQFVSASQNYVRHWHEKPVLLCRFLLCFAASPCHCCRALERMTLGRTVMHFSLRYWWYIRTGPPSAFVRRAFAAVVWLLLLPLLPLFMLPPPPPPPSCCVGAPNNSNDTRSVIGSEHFFISTPCGYYALEYGDHRPPSNKCQPPGLPSLLTPPPPSCLFVFTREWADGGAPLWYFPLAGEFRLAEPPHITGGLLCEEMGLGKTIEVRRD